MAFRESRKIFAFAEIFIDVRIFFGHSWVRMINENLTPLQKLEGNLEQRTPEPGIGPQERLERSESKAQLRQVQGSGTDQVRNVKKKKENPMSNSNTKAQGEGVNMGNWHNGLTDSVRDLMGIQFRTAQVMMDKTMSLGQSWTDYLQTQMHEGMKLSQECVKYGWTLTENLKRSAFEATDRTFRAPSA